MYKMTEGEWRNNVAVSVAYLNCCGGISNPAWIKAIRSALRVARDFDHDVKVLWDDNTRTYKQYGKGERAVGNFDVCQPTGHVIH